MRFFPLLAVIAATLTSCDQPASTPGPDAGEPSANTAWPATLSTKGGSFSVTIAPTKGTIVRNEHFSLDVSVKSTKTDSVPLKLVVDADMPAHKHGMHTKPEVTGMGGNKFRIDGMLFHMSGYWEITVDVTAANVTERATFPVTIE